MFKSKKISGPTGSMVTLAIVIIVCFTMSAGLFHDCRCCSSKEKISSVHADCCLVNKKSAEACSLEKQCTCLEQEPLENFTAVENRTVKSEQEILITVNTVPISILNDTGNGQKNTYPLIQKLTRTIYNNTIFTLTSSFLI